MPSWASGLVGFRLAVVAEVRLAKRDRPSEVQGRHHPRRWAPARWKDGVEADLQKDWLRVRYDPAQVTVEQMLGVIDEHGFRGKVVESP